MSSRCPAPRFRVVVPAFNAEATVEDALRSVLAQTCPDFEVVVVDDGSTDGTAERVRAVADRRIHLVQQANQGLAGARNTGIRASRARYVSLLDSDDVWLPTYLEEMGKALEAHPDAGFAYADAYVFDEDRRAVPRATGRRNQSSPRRPPATAHAQLRALLERNWVFGLVTIRRDVLERVGAFDARLRACEDWDLWLRLTAQGHRAVHVPRPLAVYRLRAGSLSRQVELMARSQEQVLRRVRDELPVPPDVRELAEHRLAQVQWRAGVEAASPVFRAAARARRFGGRGRRRLLRRWLWHRHPPAEVLAALPELRRA